jgi:hypothetical protein
LLKNITYESAWKLAFFIAGPTAVLAITIVLAVNSYNKRMQRKKGVGFDKQEKHSNILLNPLFKSAGTDNINFSAV